MGICTHYPVGNDVRWYKPLVSGVASTHLIIINDSLMPSIQRNKKEEETSQGEGKGLCFHSLHLTHMVFLLTFFPFSL